MNTENNIEKLFEEKFQKYQPDPSADLWTKISRQLKWQNFMRPRWNSFNIGYLSAIVLGTVLVTLALSRNNDASDSEANSNLTQEMVTVSGNSNNDADIPMDNDLSTESKSNSKESAANIKALNKNTTTESDKTDIFIENTPNQIEKVNNTEILVQKSNPESLLQNQEGTSLPLRAFYISSCIEGCAPLHVTFTNLSSEAMEYSWSFGDGGQSNDVNPEYIFDEAGEYFITLTAKNEDEEISVYHNLITVNEVPEASFMVDKEEGILNNIAVYFYNYSQGAENYVWDFGDGAQSTAANPTHHYDALADYDIVLKATSDKGCIDTTILSNALNREDPHIKIPNVFSPNIYGPNGGYYSNGENKNEIFYPSLEEAPVEYQLRIFNRHGNLIFESKDINIGWDGYYMQQLQPRGVYIYKLRMKFENGEYIVKMGDITLFSPE